MHGPRNEHLGMDGGRKGNTASAPDEHFTFIDPSVTTATRSKFTAPRFADLAAVSAASAATFTPYKWSWVELVTSAHRSHLGTRYRFIGSSVDPRATALFVSRCRGRIT